MAKMGIMTSSRAHDAALAAAGGRLPDCARVKPLLRLPIFFAVLLAADIGAQVARFWSIRHRPAAGADWAPLAASLLLAAALRGIYTLLVRSMERRIPGELAPRPIQGAAGIALGLALFSSVFAVLHLAAGAHHPRRPLDADAPACHDLTPVSTLIRA